jgi:hypothetical protein
VAWGQQQHRLAWTFVMRFEVLASVVTKSTVFWYIKPRSSLKFNLHVSSVYSTLKMDAIRCPETSDFSGPHAVVSGQIYSE